MFVTGLQLRSSYIFVLSIFTQQISGHDYNIKDKFYIKFHFGHWLNWPLVFVLASLLLGQLNWKRTWKYNEQIVQKSQDSFDCSFLFASHDSPLPPFSFWFQPLQVTRTQHNLVILLWIARPAFLVPFFMLWHFEMLMSKSTTQELTESWII